MPARRVFVHLTVPDRRRRERRGVLHKTPQPKADGLPLRRRKRRLRDPGASPSLGTTPTHTSSIGPGQVKRGQTRNRGSTRTAMCFIDLLWRAYVTLKSPRKWCKRRYSLHFANMHRSPNAQAYAHGWSVSCVTKSLITVGHATGFRQLWSPKTRSRPAPEQPARPRNRENSGQSSMSACRSWPLRFLRLSSCMRSRS